MRTTNPTTGRGTITYEPFRAAFTGTLMTWVSADHQRYQFYAPHPRIEKGMAYMIQMNKETNRVRLIPVVPAIRRRVKP